MVVKKDRYLRVEDKEMHLFHSPVQIWFKPPQQKQLKIKKGGEIHFCNRENINIEARGL